MGEPSPWCRTRLFTKAPLSSHHFSCEVTINQWWWIDWLIDWLPSHLLCCITLKNTLQNILKCLRQVTTTVQMLTYWSKWFQNTQWRKFHFLFDYKTWFEKICSAGRVCLSLSSDCHCSNDNTQRRKFNFLFDYKTWFEKICSRVGGEISGCVWVFQVTASQRFVLAA